MDAKISKANLIAEKGKLKQKFARLTDDDLLHEEAEKKREMEKIEPYFFKQKMN